VGRELSATVTDLPLIFRNPNATICKDLQIAKNQDKIKAI